MRVSERERGRERKEFVGIVWKKWIKKISRISTSKPFLTIVTESTLMAYERFLIEKIFFITGLMP